MGIGKYILSGYAYSQGKRLDEADKRSDNDQDYAGTNGICLMLSINWLWVFKQTGDARKAFHSLGSPSGSSSEAGLALFKQIAHQHIGYKNDVGGSDHSSFQTMKKMASLATKNRATLCDTYRNYMSAEEMCQSFIHNSGASSACKLVLSCFACPRGRHAIAAGVETNWQTSPPTKSSFVFDCNYGMMESVGEPDIPRFTQFVTDLHTAYGITSGASYSFY